MTNGKDTSSLEERIARLEREIQVLRDSTPRSDKVTLVVFSDDLDKALAALVIATAASSLDMDTSLFFTFWGLNVLKERRVFEGKDLIHRLLECFTPASAKDLSVSHMNMLGAGAAMLKKIMEEKHVLSVEEFLSLAKESGVKLYVCSMSMEVMGIQPKELTEGVQIAGVATYIQEARDSGITLFI